MHTNRSAVCGEESKMMEQMTSRAQFRLFFTREKQTAISIICVVIMCFLVQAMRGISSTVKLPIPFKILIKHIINLQIVIVIVTVLQSYLGDQIPRADDIVDVCILLLLFSVTLICMERFYAFKCPLKYITLYSKEKTITFVLPMVCFALLLFYFLARIPFCYLPATESLERMCDGLFKYLNIAVIIILNLVSLACIIATLCVIGKKRRQHSRRITRMGLPQTHPSSVTDITTTVVIFIIYPFTAILSIGFVTIKFYFNDNADFIFTWYSLIFRLTVALLQGTLYSLWFDECRLFILNLLSPLSISIREKANAMRIQIYNIVISQSFEMTNESARCSQVTRVSRTHKVPAVVNVIE